MILYYPLTSGMKKPGEDIWQHYRHGHWQLYTMVRCFQPPALGQTDSPRSILNIFVMKGALTRDAVPKSVGPLTEYDERVHSRRLRDDEHQRCTSGHNPKKVDVIS
jgi:hypothetical protein